jgi:hypothetical protein
VPVVFYFARPMSLEHRCHLAPFWTNCQVELHSEGRTRCRAWSS